MADELEQDTGGLDIEAASDEIVEKLGGVVEDEQQPLEGEQPPEGAETPPPQQGKSLDKPGTTAAPQPAAATPPAGTEPAKGFDFSRPPDTWTPEAQATWASLPPAAQQAIGKRESDIAKFVSETQPAISVAKGFEKLLSPYAELYGRFNVNPWNHIQALLASHATLVFGKPEQKVAQFMQLAKDAGIDLSKLASGQPNAEAAGLEHIRRLEQEIAQLKQGVTSVTGAMTSRQLSELEAGVNAFAADTEAHPFWDEVAADIPTMIERGAKSLQEAYDMAVLKNPQTRSKLAEAERTKLQQAAERAATDKADKARKAMGSRVKASGQGHAAMSLVGIDEFLKEKIGEIQSRNQ